MYPYLWYQAAWPWQGVAYAYMGTKYVATKSVVYTFYFVYYFFFWPFAIIFGLI
jgi:hypothetical protein